MAPKVQFTKEEILDAAFSIAIKDGLNAISVRKVATILGCSVAPIYVNFKNTKELNEAVMAKMFSVMDSYMTKPYSSIGFLNIGIGELLLANDYPMIFKSFNEINKINQRPVDMTPKLLDIMGNDQILKGLSREQLMSLLMQMSIFTHGLAYSLAYEQLPDYMDIPYMVNLLKNTGMQLITSSKLNIPNLDIQVNLNI